MHDQNHYLSLGLDRTVHKRKSAKEYAAAVREAGGFGFIAHPHEKRDEFDEYPPFPWTEWGAEFDGIEIWNHMSEWMEGLKKKNKLHRAIHPLRSIIEPPKETIELWDKVNQERKVIAIGGVDAHAHIVNFFGLKLKIFPYKVCFKSIRTYAILKSPIDSLKPIEEERLKIYQALREGNSYIANAYLGDAKGFLFKAIQGEKEFIMGDTVQFDSTPIELVVNTPKSVTLRLIRNGKPIYETNGKSLSYKLSQEGIYRVEARQEKKAWIYSNAIRVIK
jgi:hypothetical protein